MAAPRDPHRFVNALGPDRIERLIERLESRGKDRVFTRLFENYTAKLTLTEDDRVLEIGCGTGVVARALARRRGARGRTVGVDQSAAFVAATRRGASRPRSRCRTGSISAPATRTRCRSTRRLRIR